MKKRILAALMCACLVLATFSGCSKKDPAETKTPETPTDTTTTAEGGKDAEQVLNLRSASFGSTFDVQDMTWRWALAEVDEGLVRAVADEQGNDQFLPAGAESWDVSDDGLTYTFHLRPNAAWSDGKKVVAADYEYGWKRLITPANGYDYAMFLFNVVGVEEFYNGTGKIEDVAIKAPDENTFIVTLKVADPTFASKLVATPLYPTRQDKVEAAGDKYASDFTAQVYNGPYYISAFVPENTLQYKKNEHYWDAENVTLTEINYRCIAEDATAALMFDNGELDAFNGAKEYITKYDAAAADGKVDSHANNYPTTKYMCYELTEGGTSGLMTNANIRKALSYCINRDEMIEVVYGRYQPAYGVVAPAIMMDGKSYRDLAEETMKAEYDEYAANPDKLKELFQKGLDELGVKTPMNEITLTYAGYGSATVDQDEHEYVKQAIEAKLGVKVVLDISGDFAMFHAKTEEHKYDFFLAAWSSDYNDPLDFFDIFRSNVYTTYGCYNSPEYDAMLDSLKGENDPAKRLEIYKNLENKLLNEECIVGPIYYGDAHVYTHKWVKEFHTSSFGGSQELYHAYISGRTK